MAIAQYLCLLHGFFKFLPFVQNTHIVQPGKVMVRGQFEGAFQQEFSIIQNMKTYADIGQKPHRFYMVWRFLKERTTDTLSASDLALVKHGGDGE